MPATSQTGFAPTILIVGASRGLGHAIAAEYLRRDWNVVGTVRAGGRTKLHDLAEEHGNRVEVETLDIERQEEIAALRSRMADRVLDTLFVNAGATVHDEQVPIGDVTTDEFAHVMVTNALGPMRVIEAFQDLVPASGLIGAMSSGQGSIANNDKGLHELYRGSKAALNMFMKSFAARQTGVARAMVLIAPGWVRTELGGPDAPLGVGDSVPSVVNVLLSEQGKPGLRFLDRNGKVVPW